MHSSVATTSRTFLLGCAFSLLASAFGCSDDTSSDKDGDDGTGGTNIGDGDGDGDTGGTNIGDGDTATGGTSPGPTCDAPLLDLNDFEATMGGATELEVSSQYIRAMEGVGTDLYVLTTEGLYRYADDATEGVLISEEAPDLPNTGVSSGRGYLRVNETHAYHRTATGIGRISLANGSSEVLFETTEEDLVVTELVLTAEHLFFGIRFSDEYETGIYSIPLEGGAPPSLVTTLIYPVGMIESEGVFYGPNLNDYLSSYTPGDETSITITSFTTHILPHIELVNVVGSEIFWADGGTILSCRLPDCTDPTVYNVSASDGLSIHGDTIYYLNDSLSWVSRDAAACGTLVAGDFPYYVEVYAITDGHAYASDGRLFRLPLPR